MKASHNLLWPLSSGSAGNASLVRLGPQLLLIDDGLPLRQIRAGLEQLGADEQALAGVLITHGHGDHVRGLEPLLNVCPELPLYGSYDCLSRLEKKLPAQAQIRVLDDGWPTLIGGVEVVSFPTLHDAPGSVGYRLSGHGSVIAYATDLGMVTRKVLDGLRGADAILVEANHDLGLLEEGPYPPRLKRRVASNKGHLSNEQAREALVKVVDEETQVVFLGHLSDENNTHQHALEAIEASLRLAAPDVQVFVAHQRAQAPQGWLFPREEARPSPPLWRRAKQGSLFASL